MAIVAPDSIYRIERSYYLNLLQAQIMHLRTDHRRRLFVIDQLKELSQKTPGSMEAALIVGDTLFHRLCCTLQPLLLKAISSLLSDSDPVIGYKVADMIEAAVPPEIKNPYCPPAGW
ncbi:hypothetical protein N7516_008266 [Penicillium verrucosum]|uniref:uncharacterized protein n=1 Tax=Penicillium verrucosum TaxID=60171 RepID=UPI0025454B5D|nr:uncharacterized protein N7516_008266 [Penicillium verrucosum]KAJ5926493.1 hypothetical protein N7516_008266 [Penicillium verrucosum]